MCIIHEQALHYLFQDLMIAFEQSKTLSALFLKRIGCILCNCKNDFLYDSRTIIGTQRSLYQWFDTSFQNNNQRLNCFKPIIDEIKQNGSIDSGTKITFMTLLKDIDNFDFSKLRSLTENISITKSPKYVKRNIFFAKLVKLKFDLQLCSVKEFIELLSKIDNCAIKYIQITNKSKITLRDIEHLSIRNFMGEVEATIESNNEKNLSNAEFYLKRLADAVHYRLAKQIPSSYIGIGSFNNLKVLLQSPPDSSFSETSESSFDLSNSYSDNSLKMGNKTTDLTTTSISNADISSADFSKNISSSLSSNTLNGDKNSSLLSVSNNSVGSSTPLTSSPMSSSSSSKANFKKSEKPKKVPKVKKSLPKNNDKKVIENNTNNVKKSSSSNSNIQKEPDQTNPKNVNSKPTQKKAKQPKKENQQKMNGSIVQSNVSNNSIVVCQ